MNGTSRGHFLNIKLNFEKSINNINLNSIKYLYEHIPSPKENWYVIKVYQSDGKIALTSPIFIYHYNLSLEDDVFNENEE